MADSQKYSQEKVIELFIDVHGDLYDYSKVEYISNKKNVEIGCKLHGFFRQTPANHRIGRGCPICGLQKIGQTRKLDLAQFVERAEKIHGKLYDYSKSVYTGYNSKINIACRIHGEFSQTVKNHLGNAGCPVCGDARIGAANSMSQQEFVDACKVEHDDFYDYSEVEFETLNSRVTIICPIHGRFVQMAERHKKGQGCKHCGWERIGNASRLTVEEFIKRCEILHNNFYDYSEVKYVNFKEKVSIICPVHGKFQQAVETHIRGHGCPACTKVESKWEQEMRDYVNSLGVIADKDRSILRTHELDIFVPSHNLAIECDGLFWHSEKGGKKAKTYHLRKYIECKNQNVQLLHIFEDEWHEKKDVLKSIIKNKLKLETNKIPARKCIIKEINQNDASSFINENHLQNFKNATVKIGLYYHDELVSVMTFIKDTKYEWKLNRFCNKTFTCVIGGASKLFQYFIKNYNPSSIVSMSDNRFSDGGLYKTLGFNYDHTARISYYYTKDYLVKFHKSNFRKERMDKKIKNYDPSLDEWDNMERAGYDRLWDCGKQVFVWTK